MAHRLTGLAGLHRRVRPQVAAADAPASDPHDRVAGLDDRRIRDVLDADIAGAMHHSCSHAVSFQFVGSVPAKTCLATAMAAMACGQPVWNARWVIASTSRGGRRGLSVADSGIGYSSCE